MSKPYTNLQPPPKRHTLVLESVSALQEHLLLEPNADSLDLFALLLPPHFQEGVLRVSFNRGPVNAFDNAQWEVSQFGIDGKIGWLFNT